VPDSSHDADRVERDGAFSTALGPHREHDLQLELMVFGGLIIFFLIVDRTVSGCGRS
jgi:hypothetical protein